MEEVKLLRDINLADQALGSRISCSTVSSSFTPSPDTLLRMRGEWMADSFIKPPVTLTLHLPAPVMLRSVHWNCRVGSQHSSLHEVMVSSDETTLADTNNDDDTDDDSGASYVRVGKGSPLDAAGNISFCNRKLVQNQNQWHRLGSRDSPAALEKVCSVQMRILRTQANTVPCMKNLRVFADPLLECRTWRLKTENIVKQYQQQSDHNHDRPGYFGGDHDDDDDVKIINDDDEDGDDEETPAEFLDSITHQLMLLPMTLPSGHSVDRSTLDKCEDMFSSWGGVPRYQPITVKNELY